MNKKARLTHLLDEYEKSLFNVNGIKKKEYIGQIGEIIHKSKRINGANVQTQLF